MEINLRKGMWDSHPGNIIKHYCDKLMKSHNKRSDILCSWIEKFILLRSKYN